jgi:hypothetical protein
MTHLLVHITDTSDTRPIFSLPSILEYRGSSYAAGGDPSAITLPNIISHYTPLIGASTGSHPPLTCIAGRCVHPETDGLNAAVSGAKVDALMAQARGGSSRVWGELKPDWLVPRLEEMGVGKGDWKYLNLAIGANDLVRLGQWYARYWLAVVFVLLGLWVALWMIPYKRLADDMIADSTTSSAAGSPIEFARQIYEAVEYIRGHVRELSKVLSVAVWVDVYSS